MPRKLIRRYVPHEDTLRQHKALRPLGALLHRSEIWHLHRRSVAGACFIGMFCAFLPIPAQMLVAGGAAVLLRCNLPVSVALVWVTNPITMAPLFYFAYRLGAWLLGEPVVTIQGEFHLDWVLDRLDQIWQPFLLGCIVCGWVLGVSLYALVNVVWRADVSRRWRQRRQKRAARTVEANGTGATMAVEKTKRRRTG